MTKLLIIAPQNPYPAIDGGKMSIYYPLICLSKYFDIHFAFITSDPPTQQTCDHFKSFGIKIYPQIFQTHDTALGFLLNFFFKLPYKFQKYYKKSVVKNLSTLIKKEDIKYMWCNHAHVASYALQLRKHHKLGIFLREHNIEYTLVKQAKDIQSNLILRALINYQYLKTRAFEISCWSRFNKIYFISDSDLKIARQQTVDTSKLEILYDSFASDVTEQNSEKEPFSCIFTASLSTFQNKYNLKTFVNDVWKPFVQKDNRWKLYITGNTDEVIRENLGQNFSVFNIKNCGFLDDISAAIQLKKYFISPTYIGSGLRLKVLNAMSTGAVCIVTPKDAEMLNILEDGKNIVQFRDSDDFKLKLMQLESDESMYNSISLQASKVKSLFTWSDYAVKVCNDISST
ncbi:MAG TPA: glycosyltransferase family 4 protein [Segetibacter sp.]|jgi:hypothetical protein